jgi:UDP-N-acetylglucosamine--N-acetylmuramyl-(pentapeptide) pyrophosphoryl-undecaprenol N-acetylglucosamine transferase
MSGAKPGLIVAGGGTGGHVLAGVAIADAWKQRYGGSGTEPRILFVGAQGGIEEKLVPRAGYPLHVLQLGSLNRVSLSRKLRTLVQLPLSLLNSAAVLLRERPRAVIGVGGYASGPLVMMARLIGWLWGARVAILEQNAVPGFTNRMLGRFSHEVMVAFPGIERQFPGKLARVTGNPVRRQIQPLPSAPRDPFVVFAFGGSQGAVGINNLVLDAIPHLKSGLAALGRDLNSVRFIHQTGEKDHARVVARHRELGAWAEVDKFIYDMPAAYGRASLLVCRAGSSTLAEVAAVGRASVLVPFPYAADNHQEKNASLFVEAGAAQLLRQSEAKGEDLARVILELLRDPARIDAMEAAARRFYRPDAARDVVQALS